MLRIFSLSACFLATLAFGQTPDLKRTPKVGDTATYKLTMVFTMFDEENTYTSKVAEKVTAVEPNGSYSIERAQSDFKLMVKVVEGIPPKERFDEAPVQDQKIPKQSVVYSPTGEVVAITGELVNDSVYRIANLNAVRLSGTAPAIGATWSRDVKEDQKLGLHAAKATYTIDREEKLGDVDCWVASFDYAETDSTNPAHSAGTVWLKKSDATMMKLVTAWTDAPIPGAPQPLPAKVTYEREN